MPTIRDVAQIAAVSISTVSNVLNGTQSISAETKARVRAAVAKVGFVPNAQGRSLKQRRSYAIGLIIPDITNPFFIQVAAGIEEEARAAGVLLVLGTTDWQTAREEQYADFLRTQRLDGVIHNSGTGLPPRALVALADVKPVVFVDERVPGSDAYFVGSDNRRGATRAADYVLRAGHRRLGIIAGPAGLWTAEQRLAGYREAIAAAGFAPDDVPVASGDYRLESGRLAAALLLNVAPDSRPTALLVANDAMAIGCLQYCRAAGILVPDELGIVGFDDVPAAALVTPALSTIRQPAWQMGCAAARLLLDQIEGRAGERWVTLSTELVVRDSLKPVKETTSFGKEDGRVTGHGKLSFARASPD